MSFGGFNPEEPTLADLDGDGALEIVFSASPITTGPPAFAGVTVVKGDGTTFAGWPRPTNTGPDAGGVALFGVAIGDVNGDGDLELAAATINGGSTRSGVVLVWNHDGTPAPGWPKIVPRVGFTSGTTLADVDGDGIADVLAAGLNVVSVSGVLFAWNGNGALIPGFPIELPGEGFSHSGVTVADIDEDGRVEISAASTPGFGGTPATFHWFDIGTPYRPEGMQWPTRAHDHARTGAYTPPVRRETVRARVVPPIIGGLGLGPPLLVWLDLPGGQSGVEMLSLVAIDGNSIDPLPGTRRGSERPSIGVNALFHFDREAVRAVLKTPGEHDLTFRTNLIGGLGGVQYEATAVVTVLSTPPMGKRSSIGVLPVRFPTWDDGRGRVARPSVSGRERWAVVVGVGCGVRMTSGGSFWRDSPRAI
ncbi:MAG: FG-GAP repeat domain-containing protein [Rhodospirillales bacterium]